MRKKSQQSFDPGRQSWLFSSTRVLAFVVLIALIGGVGKLYFSSAATPAITVTGRVYDTRTGKGLQGVSITGCNGHSATTGADVPHDVRGTYNWKFSVSQGGAYCARVVSGIPSGWSGPVTNNRANHSTSKTYEYQIAGVDCIHYPSTAQCDANADSWDRQYDYQVNFAYTSPKPPSPPTISSFKASASTITAGQSTTLSWSSNASGCTIKGGVTNKAVGASGSLSVAPSSTTQYSLSCTNSGGSDSASLTITVKSSTGGGSGGGSGGSGSGGSSSGGGTKSPAKKIVDKSAPSTPAGLTAIMDSATQIVNLSWQASSDNVGVAGYSLERSLDQKQWDVLQDNITSTSYQDSAVSFNTHYYYRLRAFDAAGNFSGYAKADVSISSFSANAKKDSDNTITSDDNIVSVTIPSGALESDAFCIVAVPTDTLDAPTIPSARIIAGPYNLICRYQDGSQVTTYNAPVTLSFQYSKAMLKGIGQVKYYGQNDSQSAWDNLTISSHDKKKLIDTVGLDNHQTFVAMGTKSKSSLVSTIFKLFIFLIFLAIIFFIIRFISGLLIKRKAEEDYDEYLRKAKGL